MAARKKPEPEPEAAADELVVAAQELLADHAPHVHDANPGPSLYAPCSCGSMVERT
jgi:hypothetical protein